MKKQLNGLIVIGTLSINPTSPWHFAFVRSKGKVT